MHSTPRLRGRPFLFALVPNLLALVATAQLDLVGTWDGTYEPPAIVGGDPFSLRVEHVDGEHVKGTLFLPESVEAFEGTLDPAHAKLAFSVPSEIGAIAFELTFSGETLAGHGQSGPWELGLRAKRASHELLERDHAPRAVDLEALERPAFHRDGLAAETGRALDELVASVAKKNALVGLSVACVVDGKVVDVRALGWEDIFAETPASDATRYRWGSISKPMTATTALRLVKRDGFDLDADVRALVPEFPEKEFDGAKVKITPRRILCHQSGIVHYQGAKRTWRDYGKPDPFRELANGLDIFRESPLLFAPGTRFSYSTHAYTLLGLTLERAAKKPFAALVKELVLEPAGMRETEPDYVSSSIPHRAKGYEKRKDGTIVEEYGDDIAWKLPGGGWISTVRDLALFGAALLGDGLLDAQQKELAWTRQPQADGTLTEMGLGFGVGTLDGHRLISHSGGQRKASTYLALLPDEHLAVAAMCNTEGAPMGDIALGALRILLRKE